MEIGAVQHFAHLPAVIQQAACNHLLILLACRHFQKLVVRGGGQWRLSTKVAEAALEAAATSEAFQAVLAEAAAVLS